jgi:hypothetical protein
MESQRRFTEIRPMANYRDRFVVQSLVGGDTGYGYGRLWAVRLRADSGVRQGAPVWTQCPSVCSFEPGHR